MIGRRRPKGVFSRSEIAPTIGGIVIAKSPPTLTARPIAVPWLALGTTASIWFWMTTVVSGCQRKKLPNQNALSAVCLRFPNRVVPGARATAELTAQGYRGPRRKRRRASAAPPARTNGKLPTLGG